MSRSFSIPHRFDSLSLSLSLVTGRLLTTTTTTTIYHYRYCCCFGFFLRNFFPSLPVRATWQSRWVQMCMCVDVYTRRGESFALLFLIFEEENWKWIATRNFMLEILYVCMCTCVSNFKSFLSLEVYTMMLYVMRVTNISAKITLFTKLNETERVKILIWFSIRFFFRENVFFATPRSNLSNRKRNYLSFVLTSSWTKPGGPAVHQ